MVSGLTTPPALIETGPRMGVKSGRLGDLDDAADEEDGFALGDQLLSDLELADDQHGREADSFHGGAPDPAWMDEDSHSPWTDLRGPRHLLLCC